MTEKAFLLLTDDTHWLACSKACVRQAKHYETASLVEQYERYYTRLLQEG